MTREESKELLPIIQAFAEGKTIQWKDSMGRWNDDSGEDYILLTNLGVKGLRIKPEPKYRPFECKDECWEEMMKHEPFGWIKDSQTSHVISSIIFGHIWFNNKNNNVCNSFKEAFNNYKFADGAPFGIKEE